MASIVELHVNCGCGFVFPPKEREPGKSYTPKMSLAEAHQHSSKTGHTCEMHGSARPAKKRKVGETWLISK